MIRPLVAEVSICHGLNIADIGNEYITLLFVMSDHSIAV